MKGLVITNPHFSVDSPDNFWIQNAQLIYMQPFSSFYNSDQDKSKAVSSRFMWYCHFMFCPYEKENLFYKIGHEERKKMLEDTLLKGYELDLEQETLFDTVMEKYPTSCLSKTEKVFSELYEEIEKIKVKIRETELTYDKSEIHYNEKTGQPASITIKGNSKEYLGLIKAVHPIMQKLGELYDELVAEKSKIVNYGNTRSNKGEEDSW